MRRAIVNILAFLLLGAAVNVAVAWGCALWAPMGGRAQVCEPAWGERPIVAIDKLVPADWPYADEILFVTSRSGIGISEHLLSLMPREARGYSGGLQVHAAGWPLLSFERHIISGWRSHTVPDKRVWRGSVEMPSILARYLTPRTTLPARPMWTGFTVNTVFYGAACWTLLAGPFAVRRWRRGRRGLCLRCGYPVAGLENCPECGGEVRGGAGGSGDAAVSGGARVAGGIGVGAGPGLGSARGGDGEDNSIAHGTTPEGVAYKRASPLKRAVGRGQRLCKFLAAVWCIPAAGCGGTVMHGHPLYVQSLSAEAVREVAAVNTVPSSGLMSPVGIRTLDSDLVIVDVFVALPVNAELSFTDQEYFQNIHNGLALHYAAAGRGLLLRRCSGAPLQLLPQDLSSFPDEARVSRLALLPRLDVPCERVATSDGMFRATILPVVLRCSERVETGSCACVRLDDVHRYFGVTVSRAEACGDATGLGDPKNGDSRGAPREQR